MFESFKRFLLHKGSIKSQYVPFYLKWVSDCYHLLNVTSGTRINSDQRKQFLAHMAKSHEDWQVKQADTALRLYDYFLSPEIKVDAVRGVLADQGGWPGLEEKMREQLRLRQRSLSTEKTYLIWLRSFRGLVYDLRLIIFIDLADPTH